MKKGVLALVVVFLLILTVALTACMTVPPGSVERVWSPEKTEVGTYAITKADEKVGELKITITPNLSEYKETVTFNADYDNGDYVNATEIYTMDGFAVSEDIERKTTIDGKTVKTTLQAHYENNKYVYTATVDGEIKNGEFSVGEYKSNNIYFSNMHEYVALRYMYDLNSKSTFNLTYKLPDWNKNTTEQVSAQMAMSAEIKISATGDNPDNASCYQVTINKTSTFPGKGTARNAYYVKSTSKDKDGKFVFTDENIITVANGKTAKFVLGGFDEGDYVYRLTKYEIEDEVTE